MLQLIPSERHLCMFYIALIEQHTKYHETHNLKVKFRICHGLILFERNEQRVSVKLTLDTPMSVLYSFQLTALRQVAMHVMTSQLTTTQIETR